MPSLRPLPRYPIVVAVPARNEQARIGDCLRALALQQGAHRHAILLLLNNCTDRSAELVRWLQPALPCPVHIVEHSFPADRAHAGQARRLAMQHAAALTRIDGVVMTTDADGIVAPDWIEANMAALDSGADVVCGRAVIDPTEAALIPAHLHADDALECGYGNLLDEIHALLDPDPADPWPRHSEHSGASIAVTRHLLHRVGGVPSVPLGEDRALLAALRCIDARVRHAPEVTVCVSGRLDGRAAGGMADTMRRRVVRQDPLLDDRLEPAAACAHRAQSRHDLRQVWARPTPGGVAALTDRLLLPADWLAAWLRTPFFGTVWAQVEATSRTLQRRTVARCDVERETAVAEMILAAGFSARRAGLVF